MVKIKIHNSPLNETSQRIKHLKKLIESSDTTELAGDGEEYDYYLVTDEQLKVLSADKTVKSEDNTKAVILDISNTDAFLNDQMFNFVSMSIVLATFVTVANDLLQELVYEYTGRLALVVENCFNDATMFEDPTLSQAENPNVLWIGRKSEVFSVKQEQVTLSKAKSDVQINIAFSDGGIEGRAGKPFLALLNRSDVIYLPREVTDDETEFNRSCKIQYALKKAKFVIAPDFPTDHPYSKAVFLGTLLEGIEFYKSTNSHSWVTASQQELKNVHSFAKSLTQFKLAMERGPKDDYLANLDNTLLEELSLEEQGSSNI